MDKFDLQNKVALVTGGGTGIGKASAELMARAGASVMVTGRREEVLKQTVLDLGEKGYLSDYCICDVSIEDNCMAAVADCVKRFGRLDILVNSAGTAGSAKTLSDHFNTDHFNDVMSVDFNGVFFMIKYAYKECVKGGAGSIINISSVAALGSSGPIVYTAAKGAMKA